MFPSLDSHDAVHQEFSPRRWGCFHHRRAAVGKKLVFPTQVGMFPRRELVERLDGSFPHAGGDVSGALATRDAVLEFSPRRWGCFSGRSCRRRACVVFPTQVGMFLKVK